MLDILIILSITAAWYIIYRVFRSEESEPVPTPEIKMTSSIRKAVNDSKRQNYSTPKRSHSKTRNNGYSNNQSDDSLTFMAGYAIGSINDDSPSNNHSSNHHDHGGGGDFSGGGSSDSWGSSDSGSSDSGSSSSD